MGNATSQCLCGDVKYTIDADLLRMAQCHCKDCHRASVTGHKSLAFFKEDQSNIDGKYSEYSMLKQIETCNHAHGLRLRFVIHRLVICIRKQS